MTASTQLRAAAVLSYIGIGINMIAGLLYTPWMIRSIGKDNFGLYTLAMSVISIFVFDFGLSSAVTRFVAKYVAEGLQDKVDKFLGIVYKLYLYIDVVILVVLSSVYFFIPIIYKSLTPEEIGHFKVLYIIASSFCILSFPFIPLNGVLTAYEKFIQLKLCDLINKILVVSSMTICLLAGYGLYALVIVNAAAGAAMIVLKVIIVHRKTPIRIQYGYKDRAEVKNIFGFSAWTTVISLAQRCIFNIAPSILGIMSGSASIAILGIAITLEGYTYTFGSAINGLFLPRISRIVAQEGGGSVLPLMIRVGRIQILLIGLIFIGYICLGREFIYLWLGPNFKEAYLCAALLIFPAIVQLPQEIASTTVYAMNKVRIQAFLFIFMVVFNIVFSLLLAQRFGALGICISICIAYLIRTAGMNLIYHRVLKINIPQFFRETFCKMGVPLLGALATGLLIQHFIPMTGWIGFLVKGSLLMITYAIIMLYGAMTQYERQLIFSPITMLWNKIKK